jgi:hypothetical protein
MTFPITLPEPEDGWEKFEKVFLKQTVIQIYKCLRSPTDKFILIAIKEMGYPEEVVGMMLGKSQEVISIRLKKICDKLRLKRYNEDI